MRPARRRKSLVGLIAMQDTDDGQSYRTGEIVAEIAGHYLFKADTMVADGGPPNPLQLVSLEMLIECSDDFPRWRFFESRAELETYIAWLDTTPADERKVVSIVRKDPETKE